MPAVDSEGLDRWTRIGAGSPPARTLGARSPRLDVPGSDSEARSRAAASRSAAQAELHSEGEDASESRLKSESLSEIEGRAAAWIGGPGA